MPSTPDREVKLTDTGIHHLGLLEQLTGTVALDCLDGDETITYIIPPGQMERAIGRGGAHVKRLERGLGKKIRMVEYSPDPATFLANLFHPLQVRQVTLQERGDRRAAVVQVDAQEKGLAIGKAGKNIERVRLLARRHHNLDEVTIR
ncbi:MAG: NusA-like transcription termination signal-binding factor [Euryarchaeota archaeon]|nr:NusA-like transcription termination signal-binding factor [Euryarchaeota archaeon]